MAQLKSTTINQPGTSVDQHAGSAPGIRLPLISTWTERYGLPYVMAWLHRTSGVLLVLFLGYHIYTLQALSDPEIYNTKMQLLSHPVLLFLEWSLAIPVIFHAFNGGRLILYESFRIRSDAALMRWMLALLITYCAVLGLLMLLGTQSVSATFFWLLAMTAGVIVTIRGALQILFTPHLLTWKLQRLSGLFLIVMVPAHLLFMHLNPTIAKDAATIMTRLQQPFIKLVDLCLLVAICFHGAYGVTSIVKDYLAGEGVRRAATVIIAAAMMLLFFAGLRVLI